MFNLFGKKKTLLSPDEQNLIVLAIQEAEKNTSGEIRVFIESRCSYIDAMDRASEIFHKLNMTETKNRNGVLIYVALEDHQLALYGDEGIWKKTNHTDFWHKEFRIARAYFQKGKIAEGIAEVAKHIGLTLAQHFPYNSKTDKNELPDDIVFGK
jgi:uncharacterized membrane protein